MPYRVVGLVVGPKGGFLIHSLFRLTICFLLDSGDFVFIVIVV